MKLSGDVSPRWMYVKAGLFLVILAMSVTTLLLELPSWRTAVLVALIVWSSARAYYFAFYVIERYIDPSFRFAGLWDALRHLMGRRR